MEEEEEEEAEEEEGEEEEEEEEAEEEEGEEQEEEEEEGEEEEDNCKGTEIIVADQTCYHIQSRSTDTGRSRPNFDPVTQVTC